MVRKGPPLFQSIAKGASITFIGTTIGMVVQFSSKAIIARVLGPNDYGLLMISLSALYMLNAVGRLGLDVSVARFVSYHETKAEWNKLKGVIQSSTRASLAISVVVSCILYLGSDLLATRFFDAPRLGALFKIFSAALPFLTVGNVLRGTIRGFRRMDYIEYADQGIKQGIILVVAISASVLGFGVVGITYGYSVAFVAVAGAYVYFLVKSFSATRRWTAIDSDRTYKKLLRFSWPLVASQQLNQTRKRADSLLIGYFMASAPVGIFNAALPIAKLLQVVLSSINRILMPSMTELYADGDIDRFSRSYQTVARWTLFLTLPIYVLFVFEGITIIGIVFGSSYTSAYSALAILSTGFLINAVSGSFGEALIAIGKTKVIMALGVAGLVTNLILNILLIPLIGVNGAAIAASGSLIVVTALGAYSLYVDVAVHPFTIGYGKILISSILPALAVGVISIEQGWILDLVELGIEASLMYSTMLLQLYLFNGLRHEEKELIGRLLG